MTPFLQAIVEYLQSNFTYKQVGEIDQLFSELPGTVTHPDIDIIIDTIEKNNDWSRVGNYLTDIAVVCYFELFDAKSGQLKQDIIDALNAKQPDAYNKLKNDLGEEGINKAILNAYLHKMLLNSCDTILVSKAEEAKEDEMHFLNLKARVNEAFSDFVKNFNLMQCRHLALSCSVVGSTIKEAFDKLKQDSESSIKQDKTLEDLLADLERLANDAKSYILPIEIQQCEELISQIREQCPRCSIQHFEQIVDNGYDKIMKKEFATHKNHTDRAYHEAQAKRDLVRLQNDLNEELVRLYQLVEESKSSISKKDSGVKNYQEYCDKFESEVNKLSAKLPVINNLLGTELTENDVIKIKLEVMSDSISISQVQIELQKLHLATRGKEETKISALDSFSRSLEQQKQEINAKLRRPKRLQPDDLQVPIKAIRAMRESVTQDASGHSSWLFAFLSKLGFRINTRSQEIMKSAESRLARVGRTS